MMHLTSDIGRSVPASISKRDRNERNSHRRQVHRYICSGKQWRKVGPRSVSPAESSPQQSSDRREFTDAEHVLRQTTEVESTIINQRHCPDKHQGKQLVTRYRKRYASDSASPKHYFGGIKREDMRQ